jgi:DNA-binding NarL/FixJ family response regulator
LLIEKEELGEVIAEAENGKVFLDLLGKMDPAPALVLMDIEMPVMDGMEATRKAKAMNPELKILVLSMLSNKGSYTNMINSGALGFVLKTSGKKELEAAIESVVNGECYFSNELLRQIIVTMGKPGTFSDKARGTQPEFTEKELEVLHYFCKGLTAAEIAQKLCRSVKTIEAHRSSLLEKTGTKNTVNLILYAIRNKLVDIY